MARSPGGYSKFASYYDFLGWDDFSRQAFRRLKKILTVLPSPVVTVLDLACGTGDLAVLLAKEGYRVTGADLSELMLEQAKRKGGGKMIRFVRGDIRRLSLRERFDLVCCFFDSLNHLTSKADLLSALKTARKHLYPRGRFIFDLITPKGLRIWDEVEIDREDDYVVFTQGRRNPAGDRIEIVIEGFVRKRGDLYDHFVEIIRERAYPQREVTQLLAKAGFRNTVIESFDRNEAIESAERLLYVAS
jgi:SAM-dependent methyltransferase